MFVIGYYALFSLIFFLIIAIDGYLIIRFVYRLFKKKPDSSLISKVLTYSWIVFNIALLVWYIDLSIEADKKQKIAESLEPEKDKSRYFTLTKDTQYGEIVLPKGTHIHKYIPFGTTPNEPADLTEVREMRFPHPIEIKGISVIAIRNSYNDAEFEIAQPIYWHSELMYCDKGNLVRMESIPESDLNFANPQNFQPSKLKRSGCEEIDNKYVDPIIFPYWQDGKLIKPKGWYQ